METRYEQVVLVPLHRFDVQTGEATDGALYALWFEGDHGRAPVVLAAARSAVLAAWDAMGAALGWKGYNPFAVHEVTPSVTLHPRVTVLTPEMVVRADIVGEVERVRQTQEAAYALIPEGIADGVDQLRVEILTDDGSRLAMRLGEITDPDGHYYNVLPA